ncbi:hypothetical protein ACFPFV_10405 [Salinicoccus siamensis]
MEMTVNCSRVDMNFAEILPVPSADDIMEETIYIYEVSIRIKFGI